MGIKKKQIMREIVLLVPYWPRGVNRPLPCAGCGEPIKMNSMPYHFQLCMDCRTVIFKFIYPKKEQQERIITDLKARDSMDRPILLKNVPAYKDKKGTWFEMEDVKKAMKEQGFK